MNEKLLIASFIGISIFVSGCTSAQQPQFTLEFSLTENVHLNETTTLSLTATPSNYSPDTKITILLPEGIEFQDGNTEWEGDLNTQESIIINSRIRVTTENPLPIQAKIQSSAQPIIISVPFDQVRSGVSMIVTSSGGTFYNGTWECGNDWECSLNQQCMNHVCQNFTCNGYCEYVKNVPRIHQCVKYECCSDSECGGGSVCIDNECRLGVNDHTDKIAFSDNGLIYIMSSDGSNITKLISAGVGAVYPSWSPDGKQIAFGYSIYIINIDGTNKTLLTSGQHPSWTPDGRTIIYTSGTDIMSIDIVSRNVTILYSLGTSLSNPAVSPNGKNVAFDVWSFLQPLNSPPSITIINIDGTNESFFATGAEPSWSPDGKKIVVTNFGKISIIDVQGGNSTYLTEGFSPSWSPKGNKILFDDRNGISVINVDGSNQTKLTTFGKHPIWSPFQT